MSEKITFETILDKHADMDATGITIPFDVEEIFGAKRVPVKVRINGEAKSAKKNSSLWLKKTQQKCRDSEQAVLRVLDEYNVNRKVSDESFAQLQKHFNETQIVEILALNAFEQFYNAMTVPLEIESDDLEKLAKVSI